MRKRGVEFTLEYEVGDPFEQLIDLSRYYDLVVLGLRGLFEYGVLKEHRDALRRLVAQGVRPILAAAPEYRAVERVLIAYSGSVASANAMKRFIRWKPWGIIPLQIVCFRHRPKGSQ